MKANFFLKHCRQLREFFEGEIVIVVFVDQKAGLWHPVDVGVFYAFETHAFYKEFERNMINVDCSPVQIDIAPRRIPPVNNLVQLHAQQARKGTTQDGECVSGFGKLRQARCEGIVVLVNPVEICAIFDAAVCNRQCGSQRGTGILGYKAVNGIRRIDIQRVLLRKTVLLVDPKRAIAFVTVAK